MIYINCEITLNWVEPRKGPCVKLFTKVHQFDRYWEHDVTLCQLKSKHQNIVYKTNLKYWWEKIPENGGKLISIFGPGPVPQISYVSEYITKFEMPNTHIISFPGVSDTHVKFYLTQTFYIIGVIISPRETKRSCFRFHL